MDRSRASEDVLVCADVLGAFGVTPADVGGERTTHSLENELAARLADARDRTATLRQLICRSARGVDVSAQYATETLASELAAAFEAMEWSLSVTERERALVLEASGAAGKRRRATVVYPETPLGTDNLPAVLYGITDVLLEGIDARFVLLSSGRDRWRAALVETDDLTALRERYGDRIEAFDRPLLPEYDLEAYVPTGDGDGEPWPAWALENDGSTPETAGSPTDGRTAADSVIEEAEPDRTRAGDAGTGETNGWTLEGSIDRTHREGESSTERNDRTAAVPRTDRRTDTEGFGELSGPTTTARVSNDAFGSDVDPYDDEERYLALGAALETGGAVSVRGLLEDDAFLPEIPAAEPEETRIEFEEPFDPDAVSRASAVAEESGFEWVDAGSMETTRISNG
ncbi:hypothetical protein [Natrialbaceae archaeon AArc-T1-2]|uniref:hypothetical protein n=1 Tax=Natrialbaceae archaeon AArc-T1-2 TaxID=3053904 RepID=UPI00255B171A|nr:hypothetical protein [Natrialbaceae archaeon AArc-T1-2]WIV68634.1 hypothetical protein QQ977_07900 [Natrialbaceae archaeon AArc-T1-2]